MRVERVALAQDPLVGRRCGSINGSSAAAAAVLEATGHDEDGQEGVGVEQEEVVDVGEALQIVGGLPFPCCCFFRCLLLFPPPGKRQRGHTQRRVNVS